jgi:hypothetical protein
MGLNLEAKIGLNSASFERGMVGVGKSVADSIKYFAAAAIGIFAIERALSATMETAKELVNESKRMGITIEYLQVLRKAASDAGVEADRLAEAYAKVSEFRAKALGSGKDTVMVMRMTNLLGMNRSDVLNSSTEDIMKKIGDKLRSTNPQEITQALKDVFGKAFGPIIPLLTRDMGALQTQMESLGMIISSKVATQLYQLDVQLSSIKNIFISALAPVLVQVVEMFLGLLTSGGLVSQAFEGMIFKIKEFTGQSSAPSFNGYSTQQRADLATKALDLMQKTSPDKALELTGHQSPLAKGSMLATGFGSIVNSRNAGGAFADFQGKTGADFFHYLQQLIATSTTITQQAATDASKVIQGIQTWIDKFKNGDIPAPAKPNFENLEGLQSTIKSRVPDDALVKVGNFLGSSRPALSNVQNLIAKHTQATADNTKRIADHLDNKSQHPPLPPGNFQKAMWPAN